ncbi:MAG: hypothetical protein WC682_01885 [Parcubacteria group bacterium]
MNCNCKKCIKIGGHVLILFSMIALIFSAIVSLFKVELYLAGTQWMLVAIILAIYANIFFANKCSCDQIK